MFDFCYALNALVFSLILLPLFSGDARSWGSWQLLFERRPAAWGFPCAFAPVSYTHLTLPTTPYV